MLLLSCYFIIFYLILIFSLHCQLFLLISGYYTTCNIKITYQCKIIIVPEEGWFGQPKYSTHNNDDDDDDADDDDADDDDDDDDDDNDDDVDGKDDDNNDE